MQFCWGVYVVLRKGSRFPQKNFALEIWGVRVSRGGLEGGPGLGRAGTARWRRGAGGDLV